MICIGRAIRSASRGPERDADAWVEALEIEIEDLDEAVDGVELLDATLWPEAPIARPVCTCAEAGIAGNATPVGVNGPSSLLSGCGPVDVALMGGDLLCGVANDLAPGHPHSVIPSSASSSSPGAPK
jgi:hypothetical protein